MDIETKIELTEFLEYIKYFVDWEDIENIQNMIGELLSKEGMREEYKQLKI